MTVSAIAARTQAAPVRVLPPPGEAGGAAAPGGAPFGATLADALDRVDATQKAADAQVGAFVAGETEDVHGVMIALNQAEMHFQLLTEVRNKMLEGYQEIMRMQV
jgi:flagellar hook-basal body complex protein FliE